MSCNCSANGVDKPFSHPKWRANLTIACGEVLMTLIAKLLVGRVKVKVLENVSDYDMGFGKSMGCESIILAIQAAYMTEMQRGGEFVLLQTDLENAFGACFRETLMEVAASVAPETIPFLRFRYDNLKLVFKSDKGRIIIDPICGCADINKKFVGIEVGVEISMWGEDIKYKDVVFLKLIIKTQVSINMQGGNSSGYCFSTFLVFTFHTTSSSWLQANRRLEEKTQ
jgi:hypothetical protein